MYACTLPRHSEFRIQRLDKRRHIVYNEEKQQKEAADMDELERRISEMECAQEDLEKQTGRLSAQMRTANESMQKILQKLVDLQDTYRTLTGLQQETLDGLRSVKHTLRQLSERTDRLEEQADAQEEYTERLRRDTGTLSRDMDALYEDMNALSNETRFRWRTMREKLESVLWDAEDIDDDEDEDEDDVDDEEEGDDEA